MALSSIVKLLPLGTVDDLMNYCTQPSASCNSASGRPPHLGLIVLTILKTGMKLLYNITPFKKMDKPQVVYRFRNVMK